MGQSLLQGELTITTDMEELGNALFLDTVPESWTKLAYPSLQGLGGWYADLLLRIKVLFFRFQIFSKNKGTYSDWRD